MPKGIDWRTDGVEKSIALSSKNHQPIFLYWGAVWCPPCNQMKKTVFETNDFKKIIKKYVAVYLDGDTNEAQVWADKLKTKGYPTMIIMNEKGQEVFRLPTGISPQEYIDLLTTLSLDLKNISELVKKPLEQLTSLEWNILSAHSWSQDDSTLNDKMAFFDHLFQKVPTASSLAKSRFFFYSMEQMIETKKESSNKVTYANYLKELLQNDQLILNNASYLSLYSAEIMEILLTKEEIKNLGTILAEKLWKLGESSAMTLDDRLALYSPIIQIEKKLNDNISQATKDKITQIALKTAKEAKGEFERQALVDRAISLLIQIKNYDEAKKMALKETKISKSPFYFMSDLAVIAKEEKKGEEAVEWSYKAWQASKGKNTRFRWGTSYLNYLFEFESKNADKIKTNLTKVVKEAVTDHEAFMGANKLRFTKIKTKLENWKKENESDFVKLKTDLSKICVKAHDRKECMSWVDTL
jgi:thiol-disulfide isomerase/thioredoxin